MGTGSSDNPKFIENFFISIVYFVIETTGDESTTSGWTFTS